MTQGTEVSTARRDDGTLVVRLNGSWVLEGGIPSAEPVIREISTPPLPARIAFDTSTALEIVTFRSEDHQEALAAIREKRAPKFRGR